MKKLLFLITLLAFAGPVFGQAYTYSIANDMPNGEVFPGKLRAEIIASSISTTLVDITTDGDVLTITFQSALSAGDKTTLDGDTTNPAGGLLALSPQTDVLAETPIGQQPTSTDPATVTTLVINWTNQFGLPQYSFGGSVYQYITTTSDQFDSLTEKTSIVGGDLVMIEDSEAGNAKKYTTVTNLLANAPGGVFGAENEDFFTATEFSHTGNTNWTQAHRSTTASKPTGRYRVGFSMEITAEGDNKDAFIRVQLDDTTTMFNHFLRDYGQHADAEWRTVTGFYYVTFGSATTHNIDIDVKLASSGETVYVRNRKVEIWKVSN